MKRRYIKLTAWLISALIFAVSLTSCDNSAYNEFLDALESAEASVSTEAEGTDDAQGSDTEGETEENGSEGTEFEMNTDTDASSDTETTDESEESTEPDGKTETSSNSADNGNKGDTIQNITNNTINITASNTNSVTYASAKGLRSAVSVYCTFEVTSSGSSPWNPKPSTQTYYAIGSGVIYKIDTEGNAFIITNHHVVYESSSDTENGISSDIYIYLYGLENEAYSIPATYVGGSANYDLAVLRIDKSEVLKKAYESGAAAAVEVANSDELAPGQTTVVIGNPSADELGGISVTSGIVSVDSEYITMTSNTGSGEVEFRVIRTDAPVNSGNSGGGMYNDSGELIGIVNAKYASSEVANVGYALPSNVVRAIADNIIDYCYGTECESVMRGLLGITIEVRAYDTYYDAEKGILVRTEEVSVHEVTTGGLGEAILSAGDIVKSITISDKTVNITRQHHLIDAMLDVRVGDTVSLVIIRDEAEMTVSTVISEECLAAY